MTDEQFNELMDSIEEIKERLTALETINNNLIKIGEVVVKIANKEK